MSAICKILIGVLLVILCSCDKPKRAVKGSFSMALVHPQSTNLVASIDATNGISVAGYRLIKAHPAAVVGQLPTQYWVDNQDLMTATDLLSAEVKASELPFLTRAQYEDAMKKYGKGRQGITNVSYEDWLKASREPRHDVILTFSPSGKAKFADITGNHAGRQLAMIVDGKVVSVPVIHEPVTGGMAVVSGNFTRTEADDLVKRIYGLE